eukprot:744476-Karenia_brevis.AAC.1
MAAASTDETKLWKRIQKHGRERYRRRKVWQNPNNSLESLGLMCDWIRCAKDHLRDRHTRLIWPVVTKMLKQKLSFHNMMQCWMISARICLRSATI